MSTLAALLTVALILRGTRLIVSDEITFQIRARIVVRLGVNHPISVLVTCSWCMSVWVGAGIAACWWQWGETRWWMAVCLAGTASLLAGWAARWIDTERED